LYPEDGNSRPLQIFASVFQTTNVGFEVHMTVTMKSTVFWREPNVSEEHFDFIFKVEDYAKQETSRNKKQNHFSQLADCFLFLIFYLQFDSEDEAMSSSET
jgi:hypothetical protein